MSNDGTLRIRVLGDINDFQSKMKGVDSGLGQLSKYALPAIGTAAATAFGFATKGALEAQDAQGEYMRQTGKSREEAKQFVSSMDSLAGSAGTVGMKFEDLAGLGATVETQFHTTGEETRRLTEGAAEYAKAVKADAVPATEQLEDTLSAYNEGADRAIPLTDQLTASHHKFGTEAGPESLKALQDMAPALAAANGGLDDGIGFLNLFEDAGLDAGAAAVGLNKAVKNLKPGQTIDDLIAQVGAIEDPTLRAQKAIDLFGQKAGPKLAQAIKPGMTSLDEYKVSTEDAAGATHQAAEDMLTDTDKIRGYFDKALAGARELGQQFGPAITGIASLGSLAAPFASGMLDLIKSVAARILPTAVATAAARATADREADAPPPAAALNAGSVAGAPGGAAALGAGSALGLLALAGLAQQVQFHAPEWGMQVGNMLAGADATSQARDAGTQLADHVMVGASDEAKAEFVQRFMAAVASGQSWEQAAQSLGVTASTAITASIASHIASERADAIPTAFGTALSSSGSWDPAAEAATDAAQQAMTDAANRNKNSLDLWQVYLNEQDARKAAADAAEAGALEVYDHKGDWRDAWKAYVNEMNHPLDAAAEIADIKSKLAGQKMRDGLASKDPIIHAQAEHTYELLTDRLQQLGALGYDVGTDYGQGTARGVKDQADEVYTSARSYLTSINGLSWGEGGYNSGNSWASRFKAAIGQANFDAYIKKHVGDILIGNSPPPRGPLSRIDRGGYNTFAAWIDGGIEALRRGSSRLTGALTFTPGIGSLTPAFAGSGGFGGPQVNVNVTVNGSTEPERTADVVADKVRSVVLEIFGGISPQLVSQSGRP